MARYVYRLWPELPWSDMPDYLEAMERKGFRFRGMASFLAKFESAEASETQYEFDYFKTECADKPVRELMDYLQFYQQAGWEIVWQFREYKIFRAVDGMNPSPIYGQKDDRKKSIWKTMRRDLLKYIAPIACFLLIYTAGVWGTADSLVLATGKDLFMTFGFFPYLITQIMWSGWKLQRSRRWAMGLAEERSGIGGFASAARIFTWLSGVVVIFDVMVLLISRRVFINVGVMLIVLTITSFFIDAASVMGTDARKVGMKGIPQKKRGWQLAAVVVSVGVLMAGIFHTEPPVPKVIQSSSVYCETICRAQVEGGSWQDRNGIPAYYLARSGEAADRIFNYYLKNQRWKYLWEIQPADRREPLPKLIDVGGNAPPIFETANTADGIDQIVYRQALPAGGQEAEYALRTYLIRQGRQIWITYTSDGTIAEAE